MANIQDNDFDKEAIYFSVAMQLLASRGEKNVYLDKTWTDSI
jgi:hypothetical protein